MNEEEILAAAIAALESGAPILQITLKRFPKDSRYVSFLQLREKQGPRGRIVALSQEGTVCEFECHKVIAFLSPFYSQASIRRLMRRSDERTRLNATVSRSSFNLISELAALKSLSISAIVDAALSQYLETCA
jgi:hypothetical protein